jgi:hypothetical protein
MIRPHFVEESALFPVSLVASSEIEQEADRIEQENKNPYLLLSLSSRIIDDTRITLRKGFESATSMPYNPFVIGVKAPLVIIRSIPRLFGVQP